MSAAVEFAPDLEHVSEALSGQLAQEQLLVGIVSHDLRSPLWAITTGATLLLRRGGLDETQRRALDRIVASAERAGRLVRDFLDLTQVRLGGGLVLQKRPTDVHQLARDVVAEVQMNRPARRLVCAHAGPGEVDCDPDRVTQLMGNLVSNAIKYSPPGAEVRVTTRVADDEVLMSVHNTGPAIADHVRERLFAPMQRGSHAGGDDRNVGLGLFIVQQIAQAHGGTVAVDSRDGAGTAFTVRLPR